MEGGVIAGYPLVDIRAILTYGSYHDVDSSEMAFKIAGSMAFKKAAQAGQAGAARADHGGRGRHARGLHGRRHRRPLLAAGPGRGHGAARARRTWSSAQVPLGEMFGYATDLRSRTQGRATYTMQFDSYQQVPESIAEEIVKPESAASSHAPAVQPSSRARGQSMAQGEVRAQQAASEHRDDRSHRPRQDDADGGDHEGAVASATPTTTRSPRSTRSTRRRRRRRAASRSPSRTSSTRRRTATTRTSTARVTPTTSRT